MARKQYPLRIDPAIWEAVQRWADDEMRSTNSQVEWILRDALKRYGRLPKSKDRSIYGNGGVVTLNPSLDTSTYGNGGVAKRSLAPQPIPFVGTGCGLI